MRRNFRSICVAAVAGAGLAAAAVVAIVTIPSRPSDDAVRPKLGPPPILRSIVYGPPEAPTGGAIEVGLLMPWSPPRRMGSFLPDEDLPEEERDPPSLPPPGEEPEAEVLEVWESDDSLCIGGGEPPFAGDRLIWSAAASVLEHTAKTMSQGRGPVIVRREVTATTCGGVPLVIIPQRELHADEERALAAYVASGGALLGVSAGPLTFDIRPDRLTRINRLAKMTEAHPKPVSVAGRPMLVSRDDDRLLGADTAESDAAQGDDDLSEQDQVTVLTELLRTEIIPRSPLVARLAEPPLEVVEAVREGDDVIIGLRPSSVLGVSTEELTLVHRMPAREKYITTDPEGRIRLPYPATAPRPYEHHVVATWRRGPVVVRRTWSLAELAGFLDRRVLAGSVLPAGGHSAVRILLRDTRNGQPWADHDEVVNIERDGEILASWRGTSDARGECVATLDIPADTPPGRAQLVVGDQSAAVEITRELCLALTTERGRYRPDEEACIRVMVHHFPSGAPARDEEVTLRLLDRYRYERDRRTLRTSDHGVAALRLPLAMLEAGEWLAQATAGENTGSAAFRIGALEPAPFRIEIEDLPESGRSGVPTSVSGQLCYINDRPVIGAGLDVTLECGRARELARTRSDEQGRFSVEMRLPDGLPGKLVVVVMATDADGRRVHRREEFELRDSGSVNLSIEPLAPAIGGQPLPLAIRAHLRGGHPAPGDVTVRTGGSVLAEAKLDPSGRGRASVILPQVAALQPVDLEVHFTCPGGGAAWRVITVPVLPAHSAVPAVAVARPVARTDQHLAVAIFGADGAVRCDLRRGDAVLRSLAADIEGGVAHLKVPLQDDHCGEITVHAWRLVEGKLKGTVQRVLILRNETLSVTATPDRNLYRPGDDAKVAIAVRDQDGHPTGGVLGYWVVDEAVPAGEDGGEDVFQSLPANRDALRELARRVRDPEAADDPAALQVLGTPEADDSSAPPIHEERAKNLRALADDRARRRFENWSEGLGAAMTEAFDAVPPEDLETADSLREILERQVASERLDASWLHGPWGAEVRLATTRGGFEWHCAGPDGVFGTGDDLTRQWPASVLWDLLPADHQELLRRCAEQEDLDDADRRHLLGPGWLRGYGRGLRAAGGGGRRHLGRPVAAEDDPTPRRPAPPTLAFVPEMIVGPEGRTVLTVPLADAITSWELRAVATASNGATGVGTTRLRVSKPLHAEPWAPECLTEGDTIDVPVAVHNETTDALDVRVTLEVSGALTSTRHTAARVIVPPRGTGACTFPLRATQAGTGVLRVHCVAGAATDLVERTIRVGSAARPLTLTRSGEASRETAWATRLEIPDADAAATLDVTVCTHPLADLAEGFDALVREPHGCFEQQTSTLFPMVLALRLLDEVGIADEALRARGLRHLAAGFEAILGYEVRSQSGGFSLWGRAPADPMLTAFGLMLFREAEHLRAMPPHLIRRVEAFVRAGCSRRLEDPDTLGSWGLSAKSRFARTAFITWALTRGRGHDALRPSWKWLTAHAPDIDDPYALVLGALALQPSHLTHRKAAARRLVDRLLATAIEDEGALRFEPAGATLVGATGNGARAEATALAALALLGDGRYPQAARAAIRTLLSYREASGRFQTTHATVFALMALCADAQNTEAEPALVTVRLDGEEIARTTVPPRSPRALRIVSTHHLASGTPLLEILTTSMHPLRATATITTSTPWAAAPLPHGPLALAIAWPDEPLTVGEQHLVNATVINRGATSARCVTLEIGLPPACEATSPPDRDPRIQDIERLPGRLVIYLGDLAPGEQLSAALDVRPDRAFDATTAPSRAWPYYSPDQATLLAPRRIVSERR